MESKRLAAELKLMLVAGAVFLGSGRAHAQYSNGQWRLPPSSGTTRTGVEARPQTTTTVSPIGFPMAQPVAVTLVPVVLMSDGSVFANFGFGFEPVMRPCASTLVVGQPTVVASNGLVLSRPQAPTYTQPVPNQQTSSQQMLTSQPQRTLSVYAQRACFNRDQAGRVFVYRP